MTKIKPRRSALFMPASNARAMEKAKTLAADVIIFDLEDAVSYLDKSNAREAACTAVASGEYGKRELVIRVNALESKWGEADIRAVATSGADAILIPKIYHSDDVADVIKLLNRAGAPEELPIWLMMETPAAILRADAIAAAHENIECLVVGSNDLIKDMQAQISADRIAILSALSMTVLAARTHGLSALDAVYNNISDVEGFAAECSQGRVFGFDGKSLIHPGQIEAANAVYAPSEADLDLARRQIAVFEAAIAEGKAVAVLDGQMIEELHVVEACRLLEMAEAISALGE